MNKIVIIVSMIIIHASCFSMHPDSHEAWLLKKMHRQNSQSKKTHEAFKKYNPEELAQIIQKIVNEELILINKANTPHNPYRAKY